MSYPQCEHRITLRVWSQEALAEHLSGFLALPMVRHGVRPDGEHQFSFIYTERKLGNVEESLRFHLEMLRGAFGDVSHEPYRAWFVIEMHDWALINFEARLLGEIASLDVSLSIENWN